MDVSKVVAASRQLSLVAEIQLEEYAGKLEWRVDFHLMHAKVITLYGCELILHAV